MVINQSKTPIGTPRSNKKIPLLVLYVLYVGSLVLIAELLGAFNYKSSPSPNVTYPIRSTKPTMAGVPSVLHPMSPDILAFNGEIQQSTVQEGEPLTYFTFDVTNISELPVIINKVETSCGCTAAMLRHLPWSLAPGDNGEVMVVMSLLGRVDTNSANVTLFTEQGYRTLKAVAIIMPAKASCTK